MAAGLTAFDGQEESIEDESVGTVKFYLKSWIDESSPVKFTELESRQCSERDFARDADSVEGLYPLRAKMTNLKTYSKAMKCLVEPYELWGDYNSDVTQNLMIVFEKCANSPPESEDTESETKVTCKPDLEIENWMKGKFLLVQQNEKKYSHHEDDFSERLQKHSIISQHPLSVEIRVDSPRLVSFSEVRFTHIPFGIALDQEYELIFSYIEDSSRLLPYENKF